MMAPFYYYLRKSGLRVSMHNTRALKVTHLNGMQPSLMLYIPPVLLLLWQVKMAAVKRFNFISAFQFNNFTLKYFIRSENENTTPPPKIKKFQVLYLSSLNHLQHVLDRQTIKILSGLLIEDLPCNDFGNFRYVS